MSEQDRACFICHATEPQEPTFQVVFPDRNGEYGVDENRFSLKWICRNHPWMGILIDARTGALVPSYSSHSYYREGIRNERTAHNL